MDDGRGRERRLRRVYTLVVLCLLGLLQSSPAAGRGQRRRRCLPVKSEWRSRGFGDSHNVPAAPLPGVELSVCETWGRTRQVTCCTREMEARLTSHARQQFDNLLGDQLNDVRRRFADSSTRFHGLCTELIDQSGSELHDMFTRTYGILYQQNSHVFTAFFRDLRAYYTAESPATGAHDLDIDGLMTSFFSSLLQRMFTLLNGQYVFDDRYLSCVSGRADELHPFGDVPQKLTIQIKRAFVAARTFQQGLRVGADTLTALSKLELSAECLRSMTKLLYCPYCRGLVSAKPCSPYCHSVMESCLHDHVATSNPGDIQLFAAWNSYIDGMLMVANRLDGPFNIENVLDPMDVKISEAIMNFQENAEAVTAKVFQMCGQPSLGMRRKREARRRRPSRRRHRLRLGDDGEDDDDNDDGNIDILGNSRRRGRNRQRAEQTTTTSPVTSIFFLATEQSSTTSPDFHTPQSTQGLPLASTNSTLEGSQPQTSTSSVLLERTSTVSEETTTGTSGRRRRPAGQRGGRRRGRGGARRRKQPYTTSQPLTVTTGIPGYLGNGDIHQSSWGMPGIDRHRPGSGSGGGGGGTRLEQLIAELRTKLTSSRDFLSTMSGSLCETVSAVSTGRCWNGTHNSRYVIPSGDIVDTAVDGHGGVPSMTAWRHTGVIIGRLVVQLQAMSDRLQQAYNGVDVRWPPADGQYVNWQRSRRH